jgi:hypothetical protein
MNQTEHNPKQTALFELWRDFTHDPTLAHRLCHKCFAKLMAAGEEVFTITWGDEGRTRKQWPPRA